MTDIPDEAVQALARMINPDAWESYDLLTKPDEAEYREYIVRHSLAQATEYLTAAAPIIRADERRRVIAEIQATNLGAPLQLNPDGTARFLTGPELRERICAFIAERSGK